MNKVFLFSVSALIFFGSCGRSVKRPETAKEVAKAVVEALKAQDVEQMLAYYPTLKEAKPFQDDFNDRYEDYTSYAMYRLSNGDDDEKDGFSDSKLEGFFSNDLAKIRKDFKSVLSDGKDKDVNWSKLKYMSIGQSDQRKEKRGDKPGPLIIYCKAGSKNFFITLQNVFKTEKGWTCGLAMSISEIYGGNDDDDDDASLSSWSSGSSNYRNLLADSTRLADSVYAADQMMRVRDSVMATMMADSVMKANAASHRRNGH